jgi:DNA helicase-2/ATP-dependent DNA helicase PcrA
VAIDVSTLNPPQREAVVHGDGPLLVLAGAGSGKTRVITYRVARLVERGIPAKAICALSFTNKAAGEMRERIERIVGPRDADLLTLSTFHSLGLGILKAERAALGFPRGFTIYDGADQLGVIREILRDVKVDDRRYDPKAIAHRISRAKNAFVAPEDYVGDNDGDYDDITKLVFPRYQAALRAFAAVDFDDLITETVRLLERDPAVRERWQNRFWYVLVDEFQDTNRAQLMMVRTLSEKRGNVTVVGDDDQSIYAWRGAESTYILDFEQHFPGAHVIKLEQNYRSTPTILAAANAVIRNNVSRRDKTLFSDKAPGELLTSVVCADADTEAKFVCDEIERLRLEDRRGYSDCAVLYRSNIQARPLEEALRERRIPFELVGGQEFYERKEIKDVMAYLKLALNPRDDIALRRIVNYPARGIGAATVERAAQWAAAQRVPLSEAMRRFDEIPDAGAAAKLSVATFVALVQKLRMNLEHASGDKLVDAVRDLVEDIELYADLRAAAASANAAQRRVDNVEDFLRSLTAQQGRKPGADALLDYLRFLSLKTSDDDDAAGAGEKVMLTTLHGAKGLEWPVVFLVGMEEELLPHARTLYPQGPDVAGDVDVSEERRLAYVGITRARERLYLSRALERRKHGKERMRTPSRFLIEIPDDLLTKRDLAAEAQKPVSKEELGGFWASLMKD